MAPDAPPSGPPPDRREESAVGFRVRLDLRGRHRLRPGGPGRGASARGLRPLRRSRGGVGRRRSRARRAGRPRNARGRSSGTSAPWTGRSASPSATRSTRGGPRASSSGTSRPGSWGSCIPGSRSRSRSTAGSRSPRSTRRPPIRGRPAVPTRRGPAVPAGATRSGVRGAGPRAGRSAPGDRRCRGGDAPGPIDAVRRLPRWDDPGRPARAWPSRSSSGRRTARSRTRRSNPHWLPSSTVRARSWAPSSGPEQRDTRCRRSHYTRAPCVTT